MRLKQNVQGDRVQLAGEGWGGTWAVWAALTAQPLLCLARDPTIYLEGARPLACCPRWCASFHKRPAVRSYGPRPCTGGHEALARSPPPLRCVLW